MKLIFGDHWGINILAVSLLHLDLGSGAKRGGDWSKREGFACFASFQEGMDFNLVHATEGCGCKTLEIISKTPWQGSTASTLNPYSC